MGVSLKQAVRAFFHDDVALRRDGGGRVRLVLQDRARDDAAPALCPKELAALREADALALARHELAALLDDGGDLRPTQRHLAFVEHALAKKGFRSLYKVPLPVLQQALTQFEQLVSNWSPAGLACLRSKMAVATIERRDEPPHPDSERMLALLEEPAALAAQAIQTAMAPADDGDDAAALHAAYETLGVVAPR